jgi:hypothetical protein
LRTHRHQPLYEVIEQLLEARVLGPEHVDEGFQETARLARDLAQLRPKQRLRMLLERLEFLREKTGKTLKELQERREWAERVSVRL